jgi:hypothetical protein
MKRLKIFLRLKREEVWEGMKLLLKIVGMIAGLMFIFLGIFCIVGLIVCLAAGLAMTMSNVLSWGLGLVYALAVVSAACFCAILFKRWIASNWKLAGELAKYE